MSEQPRPPIERMRGTITSTGFSSGHRFVVGHWFESPIGPTFDVMWADPDGVRTLVTPDELTARFVSSVYQFDRTRVCDVAAHATATTLRVSGGGLDIEFRAGPRRLVLPRRPLWITRYLERPVAAAVLGVATFGTSPTGVEEWYQAADLRFLTAAAGAIDGVDLGDMAPLQPACRFGFSESPRRPSMVAVRPSLRGDVVRRAAPPDDPTPHDPGRRRR